MGTVSELVAALALLGLIRARDAAVEDRKSRQEEVFVPFKLPPLSQQEQEICQPAIAAAEAIIASHSTRKVAVAEGCH